VATRCGRLPIRNADDHLVPGDPGNFPTRLGEARLGDMFQDFGTEDRVKLVVGKLQCGNVSLHRLDPGVIDHRLLKIESDDPVESFREFPGQIAIPRTNVERGTATTRKQCEQIGAALLFCSTRAVGGKIDRHGWRAVGWSRIRRSKSNATGKSSGKD
jgi:hypothetical protein